MSYIFIKPELALWYPCLKKRVPLLLHRGVQHNILPKTPYSLEHIISLGKTSHNGTCYNAWYSISLAVRWPHSAGIAFDRILLQKVDLYNIDVMTWRIFPNNWPFVRGIYRSPAAFLIFIRPLFTYSQLLWTEHANRFCRFKKINWWFDGFFSVRHNPYNNNTQFNQCILFEMRYFSCIRWY